ncbi:NlpC/P60 family protein [Motilimonas eburnea]|uniref:NlpC/P60 family protein n=1 Tax=Motilimonas eburnea TaxID=1737488 RepID=UPI001E3535FD|nr:NlpC/P60 family protein [Motilimonas eburnea]MCE2570223.1 C40 family peptidase [Motilimonas eburnea]
MGRRPYSILLAGWVLLLAGCSSSPEPTAAKVKSANPSYQYQPSDLRSARPTGQSKDIDLLLDHYEQWQGVPYRLGGTSTNGVDCSAYVQRVYQDSFDAILPRTTTQQAKLGRQIKRSELTTGDLVFFRVSRRTQHVGVYLKDGQFLHASTSKGVIISRLDNPYWKKRYWMSRRIQ